VLELTVLDWDGEHLPEILHTLPPGRYLIEPFGQRDELALEQEAELPEANDDARTGKVIPWSEIRRELGDRDPN
jgi:hypothetical protein